MLKNMGAPLISESDGKTLKVVKQLHACQVSRLTCEKRQIKRRRHRCGSCAGGKYDGSPEQGKRRPNNFHPPMARRDGSSVRRGATGVPRPRPPLAPIPRLK